MGSSHGLTRIIRLAYYGTMRRLPRCEWIDRDADDLHLHELPGRAFVAAAGSSGHAYKFCSVTGEVLADLVIDGRTGHEIGHGIGLVRPDRSG